LATGLAFCFRMGSGQMRISRTMAPLLTLLDRAGNRGRNRASPVPWLSGRASEPASEAGVGYLTSEPVEHPLEAGVEAEEPLHARPLLVLHGPGAADDLGVGPARIEEVHHPHHGHAQARTPAQAGPQHHHVQRISIVRLETGDAAVVVG